MRFDALAQNHIEVLFRVELGPNDLFNNLFRCGMYNRTQMRHEMTAPYLSSRPCIVILFHFQRYSLQLTGTVSESGTCTCELRISRPKHSMFTASASSSQVRLSSITNTQGSPSNRLTYICFAELRHACPYR